MPHLDSEHLLLLALGERLLGSDDLEHLRTCAACQSEYDTLTAVAKIGAASREVADLPAPPARVWDRIMAEVRTGDAQSVAVAAPAPSPEQGTRAEQETSAEEDAQPAPVIPLPRKQPLQGWRRTALVAAAAAVIGVVGTIGANDVAERANEPVVTAQTDLAAYGDTPPAAHGLARVLTKDGTTQLHVHVADLPSNNGFYEVWLIDPDTLQMISLGTIGTQSDVILPLPSTVDLSAYRLVDVSAEPVDGNPAHSGRSLLRGLL